MRVFLVLLLTLATATATPAAAADGTPWRVVARLALGTEDVDVSCAPGTSTCWAIEAGHLLASDDAGATWTDRTGALPADVVALTALDCPSATRCFVVARTKDPAGAFLRIDDGVISAQTVPGAGVLALSCTTTRRCFATEGTTVWATTDAALTWRAHRPPTFVHDNPDIGCVPGTAVCTLAGDNGETPVIERSADGGRTWTEQTAPSPTDGLYDVTCPTTSTCYGAGANFADNSVIIRTTNGGARWTFADVPSSFYAYRSISCATERICVAVGSSPADAPFVARTTNGRTWTAQQVDPIETAEPYHVSCPSTTQCALVGPAVGDVSVDGGVTWTSQQLPAAVEAPSGLSCPTLTHCVGVGNDGAGRPQAITSDDRGKSWTAHPMPAGIGRLSAVDCPTATVCIAVSSSDSGRFISYGLFSTDGGVTWTVGRNAARFGALRQLSCGDATTCIAGGFGSRSNVKLVRTVDGGAHWTAMPAPHGFDLDGVACASATSCVVITQDPQRAPVAATTSDVGEHYQRHPMPKTDIYAVDCTATLCVGVGSDGGSGAISTSTDAGVTWTRSDVPVEAQLLTEVSCGSATACAATSLDFRQHGGPVVAGTDDAGATWRTHNVPARNEIPPAISCLDTLCYASDVSVDGVPVIISGQA